MLKAGFAEIDITPPVGTEKIGWLIKIVSERLVDPLFARAAVFETEADRSAIIQLDTLSIRWTQVNAIRRKIEQACGFPGAHILIAATHNHAGPALNSLGDVRRDEAYVETLIQRVVQVFQQAWNNRQPAEIGFGYDYEWRIAYNRRVVMRDGTVSTHGKFPGKNALYLEGPIDPEVAVIATRDLKGRLLGCLVNFTCHPTHFGGGNELSAGYPGAFANAMKRQHCPVPLFLNGASGNMHHQNPATGQDDLTMERIGQYLADDAQSIIRQMTFRSQVRLTSRQATVELPFRNLDQNELRGTVRGAQRNIDLLIYDRHMPAIQAKIKKEIRQKAEIQVLGMDDVVLAAIPAEYFVEHGLRIKESVNPLHALIVGHANGMIGYVPTLAAFRRGGYETTFLGSSRLAPEAGDLLTDAVIGLIRQMASSGR